MSGIDSRHCKISTCLHFQNGHHNTANNQVHKLSQSVHLNLLSVAGLGDFGFKIIFDLWMADFSKCNNSLIYGWQIFLNAIIL
jgi:hypothetical protein